jgi:hypothetical protein
VSRLVGYSTCRVAFSRRLQYVPYRVWSVKVRSVSRLVDYSTCRVAFSRLQYVPTLDFSRCTGGSVGRTRPTRNGLKTEPLGRSVGDAKIRIYFAPPEHSNASSLILYSVG